MDIYGKVWGTTQKLFAKSNVEVHRIVGKLGGTSSTHAHQFKWSMFYVERGSVEISVRKTDYDLTDITILAEGQSTVLRPLEYHSFRILQEGTVCYEIYWTELDSGDIIRENVGFLQD